MKHANSNPPITPPIQGGYQPGATETARKSNPHLKIIESPRGLELSLQRSYRLLRITW